ncbi:MAG: V-type ATP synthase subunit D [Ruminococcaceae bacterium]|nr:V-type ATP synthase subunit D [Oscillospiraceae bacterium]
MARKTVNPTRMELQSQKRRLATARKGHKLLKDKRDELMRRFLEMVRENKALRAEVEAALAESSKNFAVARSSMAPQIMDTALLMPSQSAELDISYKNVMSVRIPEFKVEMCSPSEGDMYSYGFAFTSPELDVAVEALSDVARKMYRLAEVENACRLMAEEIERTRRRVNALEHVMIPEYEENIRFITMKLDENERSTTSRLMKVKDMMVKAQIEARRKA